MRYRYPEYVRDSFYEHICTFPIPEWSGLPLSDWRQRRSTNCINTRAYEPRQNSDDRFSRYCLKHVFIITDCNASYPRHITTVIVTLNTPYNYDHVRFFILQVPTLGITEIPEHMMSSICWVQITIYSESSHLSSYKKGPSFLY